MSAAGEDLKRYIRDVPDFPKPGILFKDITTLLKDREAFARSMRLFHQAFAGERVDKVAGIEARGFMLAPSLALELGAGFVPIRKPGKLPAATERVTYALEYGEDTLEIHADAVEPGERVLIVDDLLATGGTAEAAVRLVEKLGGEVSGLGFVVELTFLDGRARFPGRKITSLISY